jgi:outer membrane murein-binding lipoprotein Lpp
MRKLSITCVAVLASVALAACGSSKDKSKEFAKDYKPLNTKLLSLGKDLGSALQGANAKTDVQLAAQLEGIAKEGKSLSAKIGALDAPDKDKADVTELTKSIDALDTSIQGIATAAKAHDKQAATAATQTLLTQAKGVNTAQNKVAKDTGATKGAS